MERAFECVWRCVGGACVRAGGCCGLLVGWRACETFQNLRSDLTGPCRESTTVAERTDDGRGMATCYTQAAAAVRYALLRCAALRAHRRL